MVNKKKISKKNLRKHITKNLRKHNKSKKYKKKQYKGGENIRINVRNIGFTQDYINYKFTGVDETLDTLFQKMKTAIKRERTESGVTNVGDDTLITKYNFPRDLFELYLVNDPRNPDTYYSCDNRRLCVLKRLMHEGFDGEITGSIGATCPGHDVDGYYQDILIREPGKMPRLCIKSYEDQLKKKQEALEYGIRIREAHRESHERIKKKAEQKENAAAISDSVLDSVADSVAIESAKDAKSGVSRHIFKAKPVNPSTTHRKQRVAEKAIRYDDD